MKTQRSHRKPSVQVQEGENLLQKEREEEREKETDGQADRDTDRDS